MKVTRPTREDVIQIARQSLIENFPLYEKEHDLKFEDMDRKGTKSWMSYRTDEVKPVQDTTHLDINFFWPNVCYLGAIALDKNQRGKGLGWKLYETVHDIADKVGCGVVTQIPLGFIIKDGKFIETRAEYLKRKGYIERWSSQLDWIIR